MHCTAIQMAINLLIRMYTRLVAWLEMPTTIKTIQLYKIASHHSHILVLLLRCTVAVAAFELSKQNKNTHIQTNEHTHTDSLKERADRGNERSCYIAVVCGCFCM